MKKRGGTCSGIGNAFLTGLLADPADAERLGDNHTTPGAQDGPFHGIQEDVLSYRIKVMNPPYVKRSQA